ncbi:MAG: DUF1772 domain-containing protein [Nonomuraea sp.]|nr:DUF1772 domain-containing protein [Nonomuraea sp.]
MLSTIAAVAAILALVLHAALAGLFYAFSMSVMPAFDAIPAEQAENAMRSINVKILNPWLYLALLGGPLLSLVAGVLLLVDGSTPAAIWLFAATAVNFVGSLMVTGAANVPMNNALDAKQVAWKDFSPRWTRLNTVRAWCCALSVALIGIGLLAW